MATSARGYDESLEGLAGAVIPSEVVPGVSYRLVARVGQGGMAVAFYALRVAPDGECPVVVKVMRPGFVMQLGPTASLIVKKEAIALGRLNERVPVTPFVVRFIDTGVLPGHASGARIELPWVAVEYVHGGAAGTTLTDRVGLSLRTTGAAFDPTRAAHAIECLASGLVAVHETGVIHRDVKPDNVLCCGSVDDEIFKIADFGVARPMGVQATFGGMIVGTLGYAAPELAAMDSRSIGPWSDVFSLAAVVFFLLTGEEYFPVDTPADAIVAACSPARRSIHDAKGLAPELRERQQACRSIDFALACATSAKIENRPQRADAVAAMLLPWLRADNRRGRAAWLRTTQRMTWEPDAAGFSWTVLHKPGSGRVIRSVAWDGDGRCLAATSAGLSFWDGTSWREASLDRLPNPRGIRFVLRVAPGRWLVGGDDATVATYTTEGVTDVFRLEERSIRFDLLSGALDDLAVLVGQSEGAPPTLCALSARRWLKPLPLADVATLTSIARIEDDRWLLAGRGADGQGYAAIYSPLDWEVQRIPAPSVRAFLACAGQWGRGVGLAAGADGAVVWVEEGAASNERAQGASDLAAAAVDATGRGFAAGAGQVWMRRLGTADAQGRRAPRWECVFRDSRWSVPFVSLFPSPGAVIAMSADGGIVEGRAERVPSSTG
jgi:serine/threonine protein kinase